MEALIENATAIEKFLLTDIQKTEVTFRANLENDLAIKNLSREVELINEEKSSKGTFLDLDEKRADFFIPLNQFQITTKNYFYNAQRWLGHVISINENKTFTAKLEDFNSPSTYEYAEFDINEVSNDDWELVDLGSVFYWSIGYNVKNGQVAKQSVIKFKRLPKLDAAGLNRVVDRIDKAVYRSEDLFSNIKWE